MARMNAGDKKALAEALLVKHGLGWTDDKTIHEVWWFGITDLLKVVGVWTKTARYSAAALRKMTVLPEGEYCTAAGLCVFEKKFIFVDRRVKARDFEQTVLHEIAHALVGRGGHGNEWKKVAKSIGYKFQRLENL